MLRPPPTPTLFPYTTLFRSAHPSPALPPAPPAPDAAAPTSPPGPLVPPGGPRSEEHTSELQSRLQLVCRLPLEKKKAILSMLRRFRSVFIATNTSPAARYDI